MLLSKIKEDLRQAQLSRQELRVSVIRLLLSAVNYRRIELGREPTDDELLGVVWGEVKKRKESISAYERLRPDLADKENLEMGILNEYLPPQMSDEELGGVVEKAMEETGAGGMSAMGRVIGLVKMKVGGGADGGRIAEAVKRRLGR